MTIESIPPAEGSSDGDVQLRLGDAVTNQLAKELAGSSALPNVANDLTANPVSAESGQLRVSPISQVIAQNTSNPANPGEFIEPPGINPQTVVKAGFDEPPAVRPPAEGQTRLDVPLPVHPPAEQNEFIEPPPASQAPQARFEEPLPVRLPDPTNTTRAEEWLRTHARPTPNPPQV